VAVRRLVTVVTLVLACGLTACGGSGATPEENANPTSVSVGQSAGGHAEAGGFNDTDVMFAQMSVEYIRQGEQVVALAERRATDPDVRAIAAELRGQWRDEAATMMTWLIEWERPLTADPDAGVHAGHGDLHSLRPADIQALAATKGADFDRATVSLLLGHLHNCVETARMETATGQSAAVINLAAATIKTRQVQVQRLLGLASS
jgi:uncharacterized protein (DUF305 family)